MCLRLEDPALGSFLSIWMGRLDQWGFVMIDRKNKSPFMRFEENNYTGLFPNNFGNGTQPTGVG
jgi:hypothetical protein